MASVLFADGLAIVKMRSPAAVALMERRDELRACAEPYPEPGEILQAEESNLPSPSRTTTRL